VELPVELPVTWTWNGHGRKMDMDTKWTWTWNGRKVDVERSSLLEPSEHWKLITPRNELLVEERSSLPTGRFHSLGTIRTRKAIYPQWRNEVAFQLGIKVGINVHSM